MPGVIPESHRAVRYDNDQREFPPGSPVPSVAYPHFGTPRARWNPLSKFGCEARTIKKSDLEGRSHATPDRITNVDLRQQWRGKGVGSKTQRKRVGGVGCNGGSFEIWDSQDT